MGLSFRRAFPFVPGPHSKSVPKPRAANPNVDFPEAEHYRLAMRPLATVIVRPNLIRNLILCGSSLALAGILNSNLWGQESKSEELPAPQISGGKPLLAALAERHSTREFLTTPLPRQMLANLLWAAFGINRPETGGRTAPSTMNSQEVDIYVALPDGLFRYAARSNRLDLVSREDVRGLTTGQKEIKEAPLALIYVADLPRLAKAQPDKRAAYGQIDAGFISQNVYLFCASEGLGTVVHELDRGPLSAAMKLKPDQQIIVAQAVGYPKPHPAPAPGAAGH